MIRQTGTTEDRKQSFQMVDIPGQLDHDFKQTTDNIKKISVGEPSTLATAEFSDNQSWEESQEKRKEQRARTDRKRTWPKEAGKETNNG